MPNDDRRARWEEVFTTILFGCAGVLGAIAISFLLRDDVVAAWRMTGGLLELAGFSTVAISLGRKLRPFTEGPPLTERIRQRFRKVWRWILSKLGREREGKTVSISGEAGGIGLAGGEARLSVRPADDADVERWIEYLDEELEALWERVATVSRKHRERTDRLEGKLKEVRRESRESDRRVEELVERIAVGSLRWEILGLAWFVLGVVATTWAPQLPFPLPG